MNFLTYRKEKIKACSDPYLVTRPGRQLLLPCLSFVELNLMSTHSTNSKAMKT